MVERLNTNQLYEVRPGYYLKITNSDAIQILYEKLPITFDVMDYFRRVQNINNLMYDKKSAEPAAVLEKLPIDKTQLTANEYLAMSVEELEEVLKEMEEKEMYEKCGGILQLINFKKESEQ